MGCRSNSSATIIAAVQHGTVRSYAASSSRPRCRRFRDRHYRVRHHGSPSRRWLTNLAVTIPQAGLLVTGYALAVALGSPLVAVGTAKLPRRETLTGPDGRLHRRQRVMRAGPELLVAHGGASGHSAGTWRVLRHRLRRRDTGGPAPPAGASHRHHVHRPDLGQRDGGSARDAPGPGRRLACYVLGRYRGSESPPSPQSSLWVPAIAADAGADLLSEFRTLRRPQVLFAMAISVLSSVSLFCAFTYIAPLLETVTGFSAHAVSLVLLVFGAGLTIRQPRWGQAGRLAADAGSADAIRRAGRRFGRRSGGPARCPSPPSRSCWSGARRRFAVATPLADAGGGPGGDGPNLAATLNQGAFNLGNATGAWLGGLAISAGWSYRDLPLISAAVADHRLRAHRLVLRTRAGGRPGMPPRTRAQSRQRVDATPAWIDPRSASD